MCPTILKIALDIPLNCLFDYLYEGEPVSVGQRVLVPFGPRKQVGIVVKMVAESEFEITKLKPVLQVYRDEPCLDEATFKLMQFCADYYQTPFGQALLSIMPARLRQIAPANTRKQYSYRLTALGQAGDVAVLPARQLVLQRIFLALQAQGALSQAQLAVISSAWKKAMDTLINMAWVERQEVYAIAKSFASMASAQPTLNNEQTLAIEAILASKGFKPWLLYGITGSGKTEVYMHLLAQVLATPTSQVLVLVPEINLTPQLEARFRARFPHLPLVALHSHLTEAERLSNWQAAQLGQARIVIGTRLSVFTPMPHLAMLIIDEEHDGSYKQQDGMRYSARDVALMRAKQLNIPVILGSATPSLETWHHASSQKYGLLALKQRAVAQSILPEIRCIDVSKAPMQEGLSLPLIKALKQRLEKGEQSLLFLNRRGYAPVLHCSACQWIAPCTRCSARLVVHLRQGKLRCHHCGHEEKIVRACPSCGNTDLYPTGHGTQRLEETLKVLLPEARIQRVDRDSTRAKHALGDMLTQVHEGKVDILLGTQMLAKGHDFPNLTLVGVLDTDSALFSPDFRASERLFAQLMQVAGRAGRADKAGEVLIQTAYPEHSLFNALRQQDFASYAEHLLAEREMTLFPPYAHLAILRAEANQYHAVETFLKACAQVARELSKHVMVYDVVRPQMERLKGMERGQVLLQASERSAMQKLLRVWSEQIRQHPLAKKVRWTLEVDPLEL
jgi:primosomal protein N' (replication factor Y) (superfamily II helicase)